MTVNKNSENFMINFRKRLWSKVKKEIPKIAERTGITDDTIRKWCGPKNNDEKIKEERDFTKGISPSINKLMPVIRDKNISMDWLFSEKPFGDHPDDNPQLLDGSESEKPIGLNSDPTENIKNERNLYRELAEERKKRIDMLENDNRELKEQLIQTITNPRKRDGDAEGFDPASLRCKVFGLFNKKL